MVLSSSSSSGSQGASALIVLAIFGAFLLATVGVLFVKKVYYRLFKKKRFYIFPRTNVKGITSIAMVIAISIAAIILLTILTAGLMAAVFRAYPGWRSTIEGVLIKVGGLMFGPIIGVFIGIFTELLTVAMTAGMFHYGYLITAIAYGFFAGLAKTIISLSGKNEFKFTVLSSFLIMIIFAVLFSFIYWIVDIDVFTVSFLGIDISISKTGFILILSVLVAIVLLIFWGCAFTFDFWKMIYQINLLVYSIRFVKPIARFRKKFARTRNFDKVSQQHTNWVVQNEPKRLEQLNSLHIFQTKINYKKIKTWFTYFAPVLLCVFTSESIAEILLMPVFDLQFSALPYDYWLALRLLTLLVMMPINILIVFSIYRIVSPSVKYNYESDLSESIYIPYLSN